MKNRARTVTISGCVPASPFEPDAPVAPATEGKMDIEAKDAEETEAEVEVMSRNLEPSEHHGASGEERIVSIPRAPDAPTEAQLEEHRVRGPFPYRSWCAECVHHRVVRSECGMPRVCLHYRFLRHRGEEETRTCLVCRAEGSKVTFADACPKKGACEYSVSQSLSNIKRLGRNKLVTKADQEPAIIALVNDIKAQRAEETLLL
jgi:hypothetical protein